MNNEILSLSDIKLKTNFCIEPGAHEAEYHFPGVFLNYKGLNKSFRIIDYGVSLGSQNKANNNYSILLDSLLSDYMPEIFTCIYLKQEGAGIITNCSAISEDVDKNTVVVRTLGANRNIYTGDTKILEQAEEYYKKIGHIDSDDHGYSPELLKQANDIYTLLNNLSKSARMTAFAAYITKTNNPVSPFIERIGIVDFAQFNPSTGKLAGNPIWGADCFFGMINTALWFHKKMNHIHK